MIRELIDAHIAQHFDISAPASAMEIIPVGFEHSGLPTVGLGRDGAIYMRGYALYRGMHRDREVFGEWQATGRILTVPEVEGLLSADPELMQVAHSRLLGYLERKGK